MSTVKTRTSGRMRHAMSRIAMPSAWKLVQIATRSLANRSSAHSITSCGSWSSYSTDNSPASQSSSMTRSSSEAIAI